VQKVLAKEHARTGQSSQVEKYIDQLLTADAYKMLPENQGFTSFNVHVVRPDEPPPAVPFAAISVSRDTVYWLDVAPFTNPETLGPEEPQVEMSGGARLSVKDKARNLYDATIETPQPGTVALTAKSMNAGKVAVDEKYLVVEKPMLRQARFKDGVMIASGIDQWRGMTARFGMPYDPSSEWANPTIPGDHYQTVVTIKGNEVLNRPGVSFKSLPQDVQKALTIPDGTRSEEIVTRVYWKPGGTPDQTRWVLLMTNQPDPKAVIQLEKKKMTVTYPAPMVNAETFDFVVAFNPRKKEAKSPAITATQRIGNIESPVPLTASCADCGAAKLNVDLVQEGDEWFLKVSPADFQYLLKHPEYNGKKFDVDLTASGKGEPKKELMSFTLTYSATGR
jgi:hypothetical protein